MGGNRFLLALLLGLLSACELSFDPSLDGKRCDSEGACASGYVCSPQGICEREGPIDASRAATVPVPDAGVAIEAGPGDAAIALDAAEPQTSVPAATTNEADNVVDVTPDSGLAVADAGRVDADADADADAGPPKETQPDAAIPPPPTVPTGMMTPTAPPPPGGGDGPPPPPGMMGQPPGPTHGCSTGRAKCGGECVDLEEDKDHCGACHNACRKSESCDNGTCKKSAPSP